MPPLFPEESDKIDDEPADPLIPETDSTSKSDELVFDESEASPASQSSSAEASGDESEASTSATDVTGPVPESTTDEASQPSGDSGLDEEIAAAQAALEEAGVALQRAGAAVSDAESDLDLAAAEALLSDARILIIIVSQDLELLGETLGEPGEIFIDAETALEEANIILVIATETILTAKMGLPDFPDGVPAGGIPTTGEVGLLDQELDASLVIFDGQLGDARATVVSSIPPPIIDRDDQRRTTSSNTDLMKIPGEIGLEEAGSARSEDEAGNEQIASTSYPQAPENIPSAQGDDIVAQQLREAAMAETDLQLKEKLWDEYRRYKSGL